MAVKRTKPVVGSSGWFDKVSPHVFDNEVVLRKPSAIVAEVGLAHAEIGFG
jgi:hypothetical protein